MPRPRGLPKTGGRIIGTPNKRPPMRKVFEEVFDHLQQFSMEDGSRPYALSEWAKENPTEFYRLSSRLIPQKLEVGAPGDFDDKTDADLYAIIELTAREVGGSRQSRPGIAQASRQAKERAKPSRVH